MGEPKPLRNTPLEITVDGVKVEGFIDYLYPNDMTVVITSHGSGRRSGTHVPHFMDYPMNRLALSDGQRTTTITPRGQERAEWLLRESYQNPRLTSVGGLRAEIEG